MKSSRRIALSLALLPALLAPPAPTPAETGVSAGSIAPPVARKVPKVSELHGERLQDDYYWLREKTSPEVKAYLEAENDYTNRMLAPTRPLQETLYKEMLGRIKETDLTVPYRLGGHSYYSRTEKGLQYPIHCRRGEAPGAAEEVLLDLNEMGKGKSFMALGAWDVSDDGNLLAYSTDDTGFRVYRMYVKDLRTGRLLGDTADDVGSIAWAADGATLFYTTKDAAKRPYRLWRHALRATKDDLIFEEKDEAFSIQVDRTRSGAYLLMSSGSLTTSEVRFLPADQPAAEWKIVSPRRPNREYDVDHHDERFFIRVNDTGRNFRLVAAPVTDTAESRWTEILAHRPDVMLTGIDCFAGHYVAWERRNGLPEVRITDLATGAAHMVTFPEPAYSVFPSNNRVWDTNRLRYTYQSLVTPSSVFDYDVKTRTAELLKQQEVLSGYDASRYVSRRLEAAAPDGTKVPVSLVHRVGLKLDGTAPMLLTGYGAYGFPSPVGFNSNRLSLLDRGFVFAIAHIRGGGEMGKAWHDQGRMMNKRNTFTDFIAAAESLVASGYTSRGRLVIEGGSAGGLLMGAVTNLRPDLFRAVVSHVPFVDVINTMTDPSIPLTVGEFEEWGDPRERGAYDYMKAYCPYTNIARKEYPALLVTTSLNDSQVMYWEPAKYVAKMRAMKTDSHPLLLAINMGAGHGGASGRYDRLKEIARDYAFMLDQVGLGG